MSISPEEILAQAIEVKQDMDEYIIGVKVNCGFYGDKFVHLETCKCDYYEDELMDSRL